MLSDTKLSQGWEVYFYQIIFRQHLFPFLCEFHTILIVNCYVGTHPYTDHDMDLLFSVECAEVKGGHGTTWWAL